MDKLKLILKSRKFWAAMVGLAMVVIKTIRPDFPLDETQISDVVYVLAAYILGVALEDGLNGANRAA